MTVISVRLHEVITMYGGTASSAWSFVFSLQKDVKDVFTAITFEVAYGLGRHVLTGHSDRDLPALTPVLRWRKGNDIAVRNEVQLAQRLM